MSPRALDLANTFVVGSFHHEVFVTLLFWIFVLGELVVVGSVVSRRLFTFNLATRSVEEPRARTLLRRSFGVLWLVDGILQFQSAMPLGLGSDVVRPMSAGTPWWLHSVMLDAVGIWNLHPVALAAGVAWLQIGLGAGLLLASGKTSQWFAGASAAWATLVWLIGNGAGGVFTRGASVLFGWPGASFFYAFVGVFLALSPHAFHRSFSRVTLRVVAAVLGVGVILQSLPEANFWHGGPSNAVAAMARTMTSAAQPHWLAAVVRDTGHVAATMGGGFNVVVILWLAVAAVGLWTAVGTRRRWPVWTLVAGAVVGWVAIQDTSLFGGLATDVNSLLPLAVLVGCAAPRLTQVDATPRRHPVRVPRPVSAGVGAVAVAFAGAMVLVSVIAMGVASTSGASTALFVARNGPAVATDVRAPAFTLTDQYGRPYSLGEHRGRVTLLTFLDPHCWTDCPLLAQQLAQLRSRLSAHARLDIVAIAADPYYESLHYVRAFIATRGLAHVPHFYFVTGPLATMRRVWARYGVAVIMRRGDRMSIHSDVMFLISARDRLRWVIPDVPVASTSAQASAVAELRGLLAAEGVH